ncbi:hypothetical protein G6011_00096 [Alternaria panax]|uniref:FAD-binding domain-containing protein n=1 Tax=Alternaria panax TaxID=48097 RepID=A0AAD4NT90_9PLEO|nr:hypothetical protein G6011_00096 [Alternaria panax]
MDSTMEIEPETTDVVICGCGPTGAMLSVLLANHGVRNIVLEREESVNTDPRGIGLDEDGIRCLQACGIYDEVFTDIGHCMGEFKFIGGVHKDLYKKPFMVMDYNTTEGGTGHPGFLCHKQPAIETHLRSKITSSKNSELRLGATVTSIREDDTWTYTTYTLPNGSQHHLGSKFLVGADGKTGFTRKEYLEPQGIALERVSGHNYSEVWVALNWKIALPTPSTHPDFALWELGYSPQQVYDLFFPANFRFLCNPARAAVCGRFGLPSDRLWRFEFVVLDGEDGAVMAAEEKIREVVYPYITHPAAKYGLDQEEEVQYPLDCIEVLRCRPFSFSARSCNKWALNRVILVGDAAHVFPPFGGQGIASGFRDAISLAWRLAIATRNPRPDTTPNHKLDYKLDYKKLLQGWYNERKQQLDHSLASTIENGSYVCEADAWKIWKRDWHLWAVQLVPSWKRWLEQGNRREGLTRYEWKDGMNMAFLGGAAGGGGGGGTNFAQVYCARVGGTGGGEMDSEVRFTDDVIFEEGKKGLFQLVVFVDEVRDVEGVRTFLDGIDEASGGALSVGEATFFITSTETPPASVDLQHSNVYRLAMAGEFAASTLCVGRPEPRYYDAHRIWKESLGKRYIILRPDRFVFATCGDVDELKGAAVKLAGLVAKGWLAGNDRM